VTTYMYCVILSHSQVSVSLLLQFVLFAGFVIIVAGLGKQFETPLLSQKKHSDESNPH